MFTQVLQFCILQRCEISMIANAWCNIVYSRHVFGPVIDNNSWQLSNSMATIVYDIFVLIWNHFCTTVSCYDTYCIYVIPKWQMQSCAMTVQSCVWICQFPTLPIAIAFFHNNFRLLRRKCISLIWMKQYSWYNKKYCSTWLLQWRAQYKSAAMSARSLLGKVTTFGT